MNREDIIRMAREAVRLPKPQTPQEEAIERALAPIFERFAALVADAEREACAKACEALLFTVNTGDEHRDGVGDCIAAIRARGDHNMHQKPRSYDDDTQYDEAQVQAMIDKAVRDEREACAKLCQELKLFGPHPYIQKATAEDCAAAIRART